MKQATLNLNLQLKKTRKQVFLEQMEQVVPWADLIALIAPYYPEGKNGRPPFPLMTMLRTRAIQTVGGKIMRSGVNVTSSRTDF